MSRVTPPVNRAIRQLAASNNGLLFSSSRGGYGLTQPRSENLDLLTGNDKIVRTYTTPSRPQASTSADIITGNDKIVRSYQTTSRIRRASSTSARHRPLMQGFSTSAATSSPSMRITSPSNVQISSVDNWVFPALEAAPPLNPFSKLRVPLLPDNYAPNRAPGSAHALESPDVLLIKEELPRIVAAFPEDVSAMSEVVGDESRDVTLADLTRVVRDRFVEVREPGLLESLWNDVLDDVLGKKQGGASLAH